MLQTLANLIHSRLLRTMCCIFLSSALGLAVCPAKASNAATARADAKSLRGQWALLIGISQYQDASIPRLYGPEHDVKAMQEVLTRRWGFPKTQIQTLVNQQATRAGMINALHALMKNSAPGDDLVIYFSGHATSAHDLRNNLPMPLDTGLLIPWDYPLAKRDVRQALMGRDDLRPIFLQMEARGHKVWVITDACYTGQVVRNTGGAPNPLADRILPRTLTAEHDLLPRLIGERTGQSAKQRLAEADSAGRASISDWPYKKLALLAAAGAGQVAVDIPQGVLPTIDGKAHGALTDALLRILHGQLAADLNGDQLLSLEEVQQVAAEFMVQRPYDHVAQRLPGSAEDKDAVGHAPLLRARGVARQAERIAPSPLRLVLADKLDQLPAVRAATQGVTYLQVSAGNNNAADLRLLARGTDWVLASGMRQPLLTLDGKHAATPERLRTLLRQHAFMHHLGAQARRYRRESLPVELRPNGNSAVLKLGQEIWYEIRPRSEAVIVLLDVDGDGKVTVAYPQACEQTGGHEGSGWLRIPDNRGIHFQVSPPTGLNAQFHFAFDTIPAGLMEMCKMGNTPLALDDPRLTQFVRGLAQQAGRFAFAQTWMRVEE